MFAGFSSDDSACAARAWKLPSQFRRKLSAALKTVGVSKGAFDPSWATVLRPAVAPLAGRSWQDEHESWTSPDRRGSLNSRSPSASFSGSAAGGGGIGVIGSWSASGVLVGACESGICAIASLDGGSSARQNNSERPLAPKMVAAPLTTQFPDDVAGEKPADAFLSFATISVPHEIFDIAA